MSLYPEVAELKDLLLKLDEVEILDILDISSSDLLERFEDRILENYERVEKSFPYLQASEYYQDSR